MVAANIRHHLKNADRFQVETREQVTSTNDDLARLAREGKPAWTVVVAEEQTAGRGRHNRRWESPPGCGLWFSLLLRPAIPAQFLNLLNLFTAYTLATFLEKEIRTVTGKSIPVDLKWPNDLWISGKKLSGILLEASFAAQELQHVVVGIGINVNQTTEDFPPDIRDHAVSLRMTAGDQWSREALLAGYLDHYYEQYQAYFPERYQAIVDLYEPKVLFRGEAITVDTGTEKLAGTFAGLTPEGHLVLANEGGSRIVTSGDVFRLRG